MILHAPAGGLDQERSYSEPSARVAGALVAFALDAKQPGVTADLAVLDEAAVDVPLEVHVHVLSAVRAGDDEVLFHQPVRRRFGR